MLLKSLLLAGTFALAGNAIANDWSYEVAIARPMQAGSIQLNPGTYSVSYRGNDAVFTNLSSGDAYKVPATVEYVSPQSGGQKVLVLEKNGQERIQSIELGDSGTTLALGD